MNANPLILQTILAYIIKPRYIKKSVVSGVLRIMTTGWPNILWQNIILQLNKSLQFVVDNFNTSVGRHLGEQGCDME